MCHFCLGLSAISSEGSSILKIQQTHLQLLKNADVRTEHPCCTPYSLLLLLPFLSLSFTSLLHSLAPFSIAFLSAPFITHYCYRSLIFFIIALHLSFFPSLSKEPDVYDLFSWRDWGWESLLQAVCTLLEFKWLRILPTVIPYANEFSIFIQIMLFSFLTEGIASSV